MNKIARNELLVLLMVGLLFIAALVPSLRYARREQRDGVKRDGVAAIKRQLEDFNNKHNHYPVDFDAQPHTYVVLESEGNAAVSWYIRTELENKLPQTAGKDLEADRNYYFRVVHENGRVYYDVCGGTNTCDVEDD